MTIGSLQAFLPLLCLIEPEGNKAEKELAQKIDIAMGISLKGNLWEYQFQQFIFTFKLFFQHEEHFHVDIYICVVCHSLTLSFRN